MRTILSLPRDSSCYKVAGTNTYRLRSAKILDFYGGNRENIEKSMRRIWIAEEGYSFIQKDQAGAEALIVAYLAPKGQYRDLFTYGIKPHTFVALKLFKDIWLKRFSDTSVVEKALTCSIQELSILPGWKELNKFIQGSDKWKASERYYFIAKKVVHASNYGMRENTFILAVLEESGGMIVLTTKQATEYLNFYHLLFPEIRVWHMRLQESVKKHKILRNLFGFPRIITEYVSEHDWKKLYAFPAQSTVGTISNMAVTACYNYCAERHLPWHIYTQTHDSYLVGVPDEQIAEAIPILSSFIELNLTAPDGTKFKMQSSTEVGKNWAPASETNPNGLKEI